MTVRQYFPIISILVVAITLALGNLWAPFLWLFVVIVPVICLGVYDLFQVTHSVTRLYPVIGHFRYMLEKVRPEIQQYFVENETDGVPVSREYRSLIYQRAKGARDTRPFGTVFDVERVGYEWMNHSLNVKHLSDTDPRIKFGGENCKKPYYASPLNISAMSYGALSKNAIMALNKGAKMGGFSHNTGEGGLSPYHLEHGGDIVWQIGTGYFGCRDEDGNFEPKSFSEKAVNDAIKMIEIKLSQGAKPGHGGMLPGAKVTQEVAEIRNVPIGKDVNSPPTHSAFDNPIGLLNFVEKLRDLSGGKPVGFKLCIGKKSEFMGICKAMLETGITPDFITIDGAEGGTGAAPTEMTNSVGTPLRDALSFVDTALIGVGLRHKLKLIASAKIFSAFHMVRAMALGADTVNSARGMMFALGCIQSRACNTDHCPTGIATQNPSRTKALVVDDKARRVASYHSETVKNLVELAGTAGLDSIEEIGRQHVNRRVSATVTKTFEELYPRFSEGQLLEADDIPAEWSDNWNRAKADSW